MIWLLACSGRFTECAPPPNNKIKIKIKKERPNWFQSLNKLSGGWRDSSITWSICFVCKSSVQSVAQHGITRATRSDPSKLKVRSSFSAPVCVCDTKPSKKVSCTLWCQQHIAKFAPLNSISPWLSLCFLLALLMPYYRTSSSGSLLSSLIVVLVH